MNAAHVIIGAAVGIIIGAMDFSLASGFASLVRSSNPRVAQAVVATGFVFRLGAIGILLWILSRASNVSFLAVCVGLTGSFTVLMLRQALKSFGRNRSRSEADVR